MSFSSELSFPTALFANSQHCSSHLLVLTRPINVLWGFQLWELCLPASIVNFPVFLHCNNIDLGMFSTFVVPKQVIVLKITL